MLGSWAPLVSIDLAGGSCRAQVRTTEKIDGDFAVALLADELQAEELAARRRAVVELPWAWLRQVHGAEVVEVTAENVSEVCGREADALVTRDVGVALAIHTADCVPVTMVSTNGVLGVAHAGWRGLTAGVLDATVAAMGELGADFENMQVIIGPHIGVECYEFGPDLIDQLTQRLVSPTGLGGPLRGVTSSGSIGLDMGRATLAAFLAATASLPVTAMPYARSFCCTACEGDRFFSHRARTEAGRIATVAWLEPNA